MTAYVPYTERFGAADQRECDPSFTLEQHIASLRDTDPERWAELNAEWESYPKEIDRARKLREAGR